MIQVSVIVCCYNGRSRLRPTIEHLLAQRTNVTWELVFVDNASTDGSAEFVRNLWNEKFSNAQLHIVREDRPGLVYARECGVGVAQGEYIIFCDDDNWLRDDYVQMAFELMERMPKVGVLGGQSVLAPGTEKPEWWGEQQGNYAVGRQLSHSGNANGRGFIYGAGMVTRTLLARRVFDARFPFLLTGRQGDKCLSGEDGEYCTRIRMMGYDLYYSENLFYWHDVSASRLNKENLRRLLDSFDAGELIGEKYAYALQYQQQGTLQRIAWLLGRVIKYLLSSPKSKKRKKELLEFHLCMMGLCRQDEDFDVIKGFVLYVKDLKLSLAN